MNIEPQSIKQGLFHQRFQTFITWQLWYNIGWIRRLKCIMNQSTLGWRVKIFFSDRFHAKWEFHPYETSSFKRMIFAHSSKLSSWNIFSHQYRVRNCETMSGKFSSEILISSSISQPLIFFRSLPFEHSQCFLSCPHSVLSSLRQYSYLSYVIFSLK